MIQPLVTVVMPTYNSAKTIMYSISSVFIQDVDLELIVVDDASADETYDIIKAVASKRKIIYIRNQSNLGVAASRNRAIEQAKGKYIAFLDSDDIWLKDKLKNQIALIEKEKACICATARELMDYKGKRLNKIIKVPSSIDYKGLLNGNVINCSSVLLPSEIMKKYPMTDDDIHEDYITWLRILKNNGRAVFLKKPYLLYRLSKSGKSSNKIASAINTFKVYRRIGLGIFSSTYHFVRYAFSAVKKHI